VNRKEILKKDFNRIVPNLKNKNILILQGPMGDFMNVMEEVLKENENEVFRLGLNYGDDWYVNKPGFFQGFYGLLPRVKYHKKNYKSYKGTIEGFSKFIIEFYNTYNIDILFIFGDCRVYQSKAIKKAKKMGIKVYVFEEGYIRPNYITLEEGGVNDYSKIPREMEFYEKLEDIDLEEPNKIDGSFKRAMWYAIKYYTLSYLGHYKYQNYVHHRNFSPFLEAWYGIKNWIKIKLNRIEENWLNKEIVYNLRKNYFLVPLQTYNDFQIIKHSKYNSIEEFIIELLESYKESGEKDYLIIKHHPMDRGRKDYRRHIKKYTKKIGIKKRIYVCFDIKLPRLIKNSKGVIVINSTTGLQSIYHNIPTICLGKSLYNFEGLTNQMELSEFWFKQNQPNKKLYKKYRNYLISKTQINTSFY